jgi:alanyl-tRNA synthetase
MQTVSVHLGQEDTLIELQVMSIADEQIKLAEQEANRVIRANYPVRAIMCKKSELHKYQLRRDIKVDSEPVRIVKIGEYDLTGCGGTHVASTAEIGLIKIISSEKIRGRIRIASRIGAAAYEYLELLNVQARQLGKEMSCAADELADRYRLIAEELKQAKREVKKIRARWLKEYILRLEPKNRIGYFMLTDLEADDLGQLVQFWVENYQLPCLIISHSNGKSYFNLQVPDQWPSDAGEFVRVNSNTLSFQGGGNPGHASGILTGGFPSDDFLQMVETKLRQFFKCGEIRE